MNSSSSLARCQSPSCSDSFCVLRKLQKDSLPYSRVKLSGSNLEFSSTCSLSKLCRDERSRHLHKYRNEVGYFLQASVRGVSYQRHGSQLGVGCCVKSNSTRKLKHLGVSRVGSVLRNLEQEDDTEREASYTHSLSCEDSRIHEASGDGVAHDEPLDVPPVVATSNPPPNPHLNEHDGEHQGAKNAADKKGEGLAVEDMPSAAPEDSKQRLLSLLDAGDLGWRDVVVQGLGHSNGTLQLESRAGKKDDDPSEVSIYIPRVFTPDVLFLHFTHSVFSGTFRCE